MAFDSVQVRFQDTEFFKSPFANTRQVPFVENVIVYYAIIYNSKTVLIVIVL